MPRRKEPHIPDGVLDQLLAGADPRTAPGLRRGRLVWGWFCQA